MGLDKHPVAAAVGMVVPGYQAATPGERFSLGLDVLQI